MNRAFQPPTWQANRRLLITGAVVYTPQYLFTAAAPTSLLITDGIITWIGNDPTAHHGYADAIVDVKSALVMPGFVDE